MNHVESTSLCGMDSTVRLLANTAEGGANTTREASKKRCLITFENPILFPSSGKGLVHGRPQGLRPKT